MTVDERTRRDLYAAFEETWGPDRAEAMMQPLPPVAWGDVATRRDLDLLRASLEHELRSGLRTLDTRLTTEVAGLRTEMAGLRTEMAELRTEFHRELARAMRTMVFSLTSSVFVVGGLAFAAASLV